MLIVELLTNASSETDDPHRRRGSSSYVSGPENQNGDERLPPGQEARINITVTDRVMPRNVTEGSGAVKR
jgi:hypothetical protein